jgi:hypothetical protein
VKSCLAADANFRYNFAAILRKQSMDKVTNIAAQAGSSCVVLFKEQRRAARMGCAKQF